MMNRKGPAFPYDPLIIPRVKQYLEENVHQTYVDVGEMARELQQRYREYHRRKAIPFRMLVEQAYRTVLHSYGLESNPSTDIEEEAASDVEVMDDSTANARGQMSNTLTSLYMNNRNQTSAELGVAQADQSGTGADGDAIDISSDEDDPEAAANDERLEGDASDHDDSLVAEYSVLDFISVHISFFLCRGIEFVARNKHVTVTKLTRVNKPGEEDSSNGSVESTGNKSMPDVPEIKRRRVEIVPIGSVFKGQGAANGKVNHAEGAGIRSNKIGQNKQSPSTLPKTPLAQKTKKFRKEIVSRVVSTTFEDVGGMDRILKDLCELLLHVKHPEIYRNIGLPPPRGFLLHGPPGSGKTLLAQAIAGQLKVGLVEVPATELVAGVSGESEERIRDVFEQAVALAPCVLFIDEIDAISSNRINAQKDMERRIVAQLLSSLDNLGKQEGGEGVIVIGATNRADTLDPALRRVGRFDQEISLGIPDRAARTQILRIICRKLKIADTIDYGELAKLTPGYVGADLLALATRAANTAIKRLFTAHERNLHENESTTEDAGVSSSEDVVHIEDEPDEVVNVDDEKDDPKEAAVASETTVPEVNVESSKQDVTVEEKDAMPTEGADTTEKLAPEGAASKEAPKDSSGTTAENESMVTDEEPEKDIGKDASTSLSVDAKAEPMEDDKGDNQTKATVEAIVSPPAAKPVPPKELTLDRMLYMLLNLNAALPKPELDSVCIEREDFIESLRTVQPSAKREGFITVPDVTWDDIGSLGDIREELKLAILAPVKYPRRLKLLGLNAPSGVLLCGPPGCGKTLLAKAVANEAGINFISVKGPELLNMYVGESERAVRQCFQRARNSAPCVIFFDEFDALCPKRSDTAEGSAGTRVVNQLLTEMDGIEERKGVFLMAATNRPDIVDPAVLRPGRLDKILYVGLPARDDRIDILRALTKNRTQPPLADDVDFAKVADLTDGYTGADLAGLVRQASLQTLKDSIVACSDEEQMDERDPPMDEPRLCLTVRLAHFLEAIRNIKPSVNTEDKTHYAKLRLKYGVNT